MAKRAILTLLLATVFLWQGAYSVASGPSTLSDGNVTTGVGLVAGLPWATIDTYQVHAGEVHLFMTSPNGITADGDYAWSQDDTSIPGSDYSEDHFGCALAAGDFDRDGVADLAIGAYGDTSPGHPDSGTVVVAYGASPFGAGRDAELLHQGLAGFDYGPEMHRFGQSLAVGDINGDGADDLVVGAPYEPVDDVEGAGAFYIFYGASIGLEASGAQRWTQNVSGVPGRATSRNRFGTALAAGDLNGDGYDDLAVCAEYGAADGTAGAGTVTVLYGSGHGLDTGGSLVYHQGISGVEGDPTYNGFWGAALTTGDYNGDGYDDLAAGAEGASVDGLEDAGGVSVLYGSADGLMLDGNRFWHQDIDDVEGKAEAGDRFGSSLASGDFNGDDRDDLAIGVDCEDIDGVDHAGAVNVLYGSALGLTTIGNKVWHQNVTGVQGSAQEGDQYGYAVAAGDLNGDGRDDLAIGVPGQALTGFADAGAVAVLYGSASGLTASGDQIWHRDTTGIVGSPSANARLGEALALLSYPRDIVALPVIRKR